MISFDPTATCTAQDGCGVMWLRADPPDTTSDGSDILVDGADVDVGNGIKAAYDGEGGAHGNPSIAWHQGDFDYSINFHSGSASFTKDQMVGFAKAAIAAGPHTPIDLLVKQLRETSPNFRPTAPVAYPPHLPVGGLIPKIIAGEGEPGGYMISFDPTATCTVQDGCGFIWLRADPPDISSDGSDFIVDGADVDVGNGIKAAYDGEGGAHGNPSIAWHQGNFDYSINFHSESENFTKDQMVGFAKEQIASGSK
jgi:hypothetical protein